MSSRLNASVQVGVFPFDHKEHLDPNTTAAYMEVWLQQVQTSFAELPHIQEQIAKEARNLPCCLTGASATIRHLRLADVCRCHTLRLGPVP